MMKEVRHGIAIGLVCVVITITIGSFIAQAMSGGHEPATDSAQGDAPAAAVPAEGAQGAK